MSPLFTSGGASEVGHPLVGLSHTLSSHKMISMSVHEKSNKKSNAKLKGSGAESTMALKNDHKNCCIRGMSIHNVEIGLEKTFEHMH